ncbi:hypothetical protein E2562_012107 [Oryza meyeriana var. granulata]|uniref:Uncharacterized protein n=1 Tax=Oryza meyeriana var. granulata TaxID=110450 RepID=A0A6G1F7A3_9ORYZ|nr:hypothetical protein E2562_012107 [Oryza meyeriana var. granulata]
MALPIPHGTRKTPSSLCARSIEQHIAYAVANKHPAQVREDTGAQARACQIPSSLSLSLWMAASLVWSSVAALHRKGSGGGALQWNGSKQLYVGGR